MTYHNGVLRQAVDAAVARENDAIERAVEQMLVTPGDYGLRVYRWTEYAAVDETYSATHHLVTELTADVAPMTIEYRPEGERP